MTLLRLIASAVYLAIAHGLGMPSRTAGGWRAFGAFAIRGQVTASSVIGAGGMGAGEPAGVRHPRPAVGGRHRSAGGRTAGCSAGSHAFSRCTRCSGISRSLLYFDGRTAAGLQTHALQMTTVGLLVGLLLSGIITRSYDRRGATADQGHSRRRVRRPRRDGDREMTPDVITRWLSFLGPGGTHPARRPAGRRRHVRSPAVFTHAGGRAQDQGHTCWPPKMFADSGFHYVEHWVQRPVGDPLVSARGPRRRRVRGIDADRLVRRRQRSRRSP